MLLSVCVCVQDHETAFHESIKQRYEQVRAGLSLSTCRVVVVYMRFATTSSWWIKCQIAHHS
jgi:hypothetical protein